MNTYPRQFAQITQLHKIALLDFSTTLFIVCGKIL